MPPLRGWSGVLPPFVRLTISVGAHELNRGALCPLSWSAPCPFGAVGKVGARGLTPASRDVAPPGLDLYRRSLPSAYALG